MSQAIKEVLWHYCSVETFAAIIEGGLIRLGDLLHMNDSKEIVWFDEVVQAALLRRAETLSEHRRQEFWAMYQANQHTRFSFCLSEDGDLLSQWRAYAANGSGVAIGFQASTLPQVKHVPYLHANPATTFGLFQVIYDRTEQDALVEALLEPICAKGDHDADFSFGLLAAHFSSQGVLTKNPAFKEEREWRLVYSPVIHPATLQHMNGHEFRLRQQVRNGDLFTFFEWKPNALHELIAEVRLGPSCRLRSFDLKLLLQRCGFVRTAVSQSCASYVSR